MYYYDGRNNNIKENVIATPKCIDETKCYNIIIIIIVIVYNYKRMHIIINNKNVSLTAQLYL